MIDANGYRANVGIIISNEEGQVLWMRRVGGADAWQFPQGGIDHNEKPRDAAIRELYEEVGIKSNEIKEIAISDKWYKYDLPEGTIKKNFFNNRFKGQKQKWFMFELIKEAKIDFTIDINPEFDEFIWCSYWYPLSIIVEFKKEVYRSVLNEFCMAFTKRNL